jgi:hypothetical protein
MQKPFVKLTVGWLNLTYVRSVEVIADGCEVIYSSGERDKFTGPDAQQILKALRQSEMPLP